MQQRYYDYLPKALLIFQHLEEILRQYLLRCEVMTAARLTGLTKYRPDKSMDKLSLGRLIDKFEKFNENDELICRLKNLAKERNFVAHEAYVAAYGEDGDPRADDEIKALLERVTASHDAAEQCVWDVVGATEALELNFVHIQKMGSEQAD